MSGINQAGVHRGAGAGTGMTGAQGMTGATTGMGMGNTTGATGTTGYGTTGTTGVANTATRAGGPLSQAAGEPICNQEHFTKIEDRPVVKETTTYVREHRPFEKEFVVETRPTGREREVAEGRRTEVIDTKERIVETTPRDPCAGVEPVHVGQRRV
jgi:hypothetical protein